MDDEDAADWLFLTTPRTAVSTAVANFPKKTPQRASAAGGRDGRGGVIRYTLTRLGLLVLGLAVASVLIFLSLRVLPGDVAQLVGGTQASPDQIAALRESLGLNAPLWQQYAAWIGGLFRGDLGDLAAGPGPLATELLDKAQVTVPLAADSR